MGGNQVFEKNKNVIGADRHQPRHVLRNLDAGKSRFLHRLTGVLERRTPRLRLILEI